MKVLIISDTHGYDDNMFAVIRREQPLDMVIHCGDIERSPGKLIKEANCPVHLVSGNNDYMLNLPQVDIFDLCGKRVLLLHGHNYRIYREQTPLFLLAEENQADIVMFGHLHEPIIQTDGRITIVNPGSLTYPRQHGSKPSYVIMNIDYDKEPEYTVKYL